MLAGSLASLASAGAEQSEEEEQVEEVVEAEELLEDMELEGVQFGGSGGGGGGGGGGAAGDPWDVGRLFGGDDEPDDAPARPKKRPRRIRRQEDDEDDEDLDFEEVEAAPEGDADPEALDPQLLAPIEARLGEVEPLPDEALQLDARYRAVELALADALFLGRRAMEPENLVHADSPIDPIGRPAEIGRFLAEAADSARARSIGRLVGHAGAVLVPEVGGYSGGVARLSALAACAEAAEGGGLSTDRAVSLSLVDEAWAVAVETAGPLARQGRLRSPMILERALGRDLSSPGRERIPEPAPLGGRALRRLMPRPLLPEVPLPDLDSLLPQPFEEPDLADLDSVLLQMTGGADPAWADPDPCIPTTLLQPTLNAARTLMSAVGRSYVELAAASLAVLQVRPEAPLLNTLTVSDRAIGQIAKGTLKAGRTLERSNGQRLSRIDRKEMQDAVEELRRSRDSLDALRGWAFDTIAGALDA